MSEPDKGASMRYEASKVDSTTWMVKRYKRDDSWDEALMSGQPTEATEAEVVAAAIRRGSWA